MKTLGDAIKLAAQYLQDRQVARPRRVAEDLFSHVLELKRLDLYLQFDRPLNEAELKPVREKLARCGKHEPIEYVLGEVEFFGAQFAVDRRVLIPRQETEILASLISRKIQGKGVLWDVCSGSGCIGISVKKKHPELTVILSDISPDALSIARQNAQKNGVEVEVLEGDLFAPFGSRKADWIVCNPPYVTEEEWGSLDPSVRDFEPKRALVADNNGFAFYQAIARNAKNYLNPDGALWLEIGSSQKEEIQTIFQESGWGKIEPLQDWSGRDRFFFLEKG